MIKKGILIALLLGIQGCVGTVKLAQESQNDSRTTNSPAITKGKAISTTNQ